MTTRLPTRDQLHSILEAVRSEPEGPDQAAAIERLEAQLADLDDPSSDALTGPDEDLVEQPAEQEGAPKPAPAPTVASAPTGPSNKPPGKPFGKKPEEGKQPEKRVNNKPF